MSQPYFSLEAELHDAFWAAEDDGSEVRLMADFLKNHPGPALEVGAGSGRLMLPLLQMGYEIEGLELSADMLALGQARAAKMGIEAKIHAGDMSNWDPQRSFAALLAPAFTLQLASEPAATLRHWQQLLVPSGGFYLTVFMPYAELLGDLPENEWYEDHRVTLANGDKGLLKTRHRLDRPKQQLHREHHYSLSGKSPRSHHSQQTIRWFEHAELLVLLSACGFHCEKFCIDFDPTPCIGDPAEIDFDGILTYFCHRHESSGAMP
jgi:SAM-dependent methyltransferase